MNRYLIFITVVLLPVVSLSQKLPVTLGDKQFKRLNYSKAVEYYEYALSKNSDNTHVQRNLAESYYKMNDYPSAQKYFDLLIKNPKHTGKDILRYAKFLKERGNYSQALYHCKKYFSVHPNDEEIKRLIKDLEEKGKEILPGMLCKIRPTKINSSYSDFAPVFYKDCLLFTSGRKSKRAHIEKYGWDDQYFLEIYQYDPTQPAENQIKIFAKKIRSKFHEGVICFSSDFTKMYFTRSNYYRGKLRRSKEGLNNLKIFIASEKNGKWKLTGKFPYNSDEYSVGHPSLSADGKIMYFVSDMPGGIGGTDIYRTRFENGTWSKPENMGDKINTPENEMFPHITSQGQLFFASNGRAGLGGLDLYVVDLNGGESKVTHLGESINSKYDDFALAMHPSNKKGYFSSNREGGQGSDDIYSFEISTMNEVEIQIRNLRDKSLLIADKFLINEAVSEKLLLSREDSTYYLTVDRDQHNRLHMEKNGFYPVDSMLYSDPLDAKITKTYYMTPVVTKKKVVKKVVEIIPVSVPPIFFDLNKYTITRESYRVLLQTAGLLHENKKIFVSLIANTDTRESITYNQKLAYKRAKSAMETLMEMGIDRERIRIRIAGENKPLKKKKGQTLEEWHRLNRRIDIEFYR